MLVSFFFPFCSFLSSFFVVGSTDGLSNWPTQLWQTFGQRPYDLLFVWTFRQGQWQRMQNVAKPRDATLTAAAAVATFS